VPRNARTLDISDAPELIRVAEEVRASNTPCVLTRGDEEIAVVIPPPGTEQHTAEQSTRGDEETAVRTPPRLPRLKQRRLAPKKLSEADIEAFLSSAGGWKDMDTETLKANIYADRRASVRRAGES
jgi:hypothetical protein